MRDEHDGRVAGDERDGLTRRRFLQGALAFGGTVGVAGLAAACGGGESDAGGAGTGASATTGSTAQAEGTPRKGGTLRIGMNDGGGSESLNPLFLPTFMESARATQLYERLFQIQADGHYEPRLADSVEANADATVWKLTLKSGITFHDGKPLTADDVLWSVSWISDPASKSEYTPNLEPIDLKATKKVSDTEIEFHLKRPIGAFNELLGGKACLIVPDGKKDGWETPNGTGPFKLVDWKAGQQTVLERNDNYWGDGPNVDEVVLQTIADPAQRVNALESGQVDAIAFLDFVQAKAQEGNSQLQIIRSTGSVCIPIYMQIDAESFADPRVREAFRLAVDREQMVANILLGFGKVGNDLFGISYPSYNGDLPQREYDPERAKSLLAEAGKSDIRVTLYSSTAIAGLLESATAYKQQAKAAGITVDVQKIPADSYWANDKYLKTPFYQTNWGTPFENVATQGMTQAAPYNETHWYRPDWEKSFREAQGIADDDERNAAYKKLQEPLYEEGGYIIWAFQDLVDAASARVKGITGNPLFNLGYFAFKDWWLEA